MKTLIKIIGFTTAALCLQACDDGPAENMGEKVDKAYEKTKDTMHDAAEKTKDTVSDAATDAGNAVEDACEEATGENC